MVPRCYLRLKLVPGTAVNAMPTADAPDFLLLLSDVMQCADELYQYFTSPESNRFPGRKKVA